MTRIATRPAVVDIADVRVGDVFVTAEGPTVYTVRELAGGRYTVEFDHPWYAGETATFSAPVMPGSEVCAIVRRGRGTRSAFGK